MKSIHKTCFRLAHAVAMKPSKTSLRHWALWLNYLYHPLQRFPAASFWENWASHTVTLLVQEVLPEDLGRNTMAHSAVKAENQMYGCERARAQTPTQEPRTASMAECQLNLLGHVEALHHQISSRMDLIERELDGNTYHSHIPQLRVKLRPLRNSKNNGQ